MSSVMNGVAGAMVLQSVSKQAKVAESAVFCSGRPAVPYICV